MTWSFSQDNLEPRKRGWMISVKVQTEEREKTDTTSARRGGLCAQCPTPPLERHCVRPTFHLGIEMPTESSWPQKYQRVSVSWPVPRKIDPAPDCFGTTTPPSRRMARLMLPPRSSRRSSVDRRRTRASGSSGTSTRMKDFETVA